MMSGTQTQPVSECSEWSGARNRQGYGVAWLDGKVLGAHRAEWIKTHGPIPEDKPCVLHKCDNPPCINLDHLYLGTKSDNNRDTRERGRYRSGWAERTHCVNGHPWDEVNTRRTAKQRVCRACRRESYVPKPRVVTHCKQGHEFTPENTYVYPSGGARACRTCMRRWLRERRARARSVG